MQVNSREITAKQEWWAGATIAMTHEQADLHGRDMMTIKRLGRRVAALAVGSANQLLFRAVGLAARGINSVTN